MYINYQWDGNSLMVQCDECQEWFHPKCVGLSVKEAKHNPFICPQCQDKPILNISNYKMDSFTKKMQFSYYESIDPKRLYQIYSIPQILSKYKKIKKKQCINNNDIFPLNQLKQIQKNIINHIHNHYDNNIDIDINLNQNIFDRMFYRQIIKFGTLQKKQVLCFIYLLSLHSMIILFLFLDVFQKEIVHRNTIMECYDYLLSCLFVKHLDLMYNIKKSRPFILNKLVKDEHLKELINRDISQSIINKQENVMILNNKQNTSNRMTMNSMLSNNNNNNNNNINNENLSKKSKSSLIFNNEYVENDKNLIQNNMSSYSTMSLDTSMCLNCNGQIATKSYIKHIEQCYSSKHTYYEQTKQSLFNSIKTSNINKDILNMDDLLFSTPYKSYCIPCNPLEIKIDEQSESDIDSISSMFAPPDINDRKKVIAQLLRKRNKFKYDHVSKPIQYKQSAKELEIYHKVYHKLVPKMDLPSSPESISSQQESETDDDDDEDDDDDDVKMNGNKSGSSSSSLSSSSILTAKKDNDNNNDSDDMDNDDDEDDEDDDDDDDDDDIPIAQNLKYQNNQQRDNNDNNGNLRGIRGYNLRTRSPSKQSSCTPPTPPTKKKKYKIDNKISNEIKEKYKEEYKAMNNRFKRYFRQNKLRRLKKKRKLQMKLKQNTNKLITNYLDKYHFQFENDKVLIEKLYKILPDLDTPINGSLSINYSKHILNQMNQFNINNNTKHCGYIYSLNGNGDDQEGEGQEKKVNDNNNNNKNDKQEKEEQEEEEKKTLRMDIDDNDKEEKHNDNVNHQNNNDDDKQQEEKDDKFEYFCCNKLNGNGLCSIHKNWRNQRYKILLNKLKNEIQEICELNCILRESKNWIKKDIENQNKRRMDYKKYFTKNILNNTFFNNANLWNDTDLLKSQISIKIDPLQTDIDLLQKNLANK